MENARLLEEINYLRIIHHTTAEVDGSKKNGFGPAVSEVDNAFSSSRHPTIAEHRERLNALEAMNNSGFTLGSDQSSEEDVHDAAAGFNVSGHASNNKMEDGPSLATGFPMAVSPPSIMQIKTPITAVRHARVESMSDTSSIDEPSEICYTATTGKTATIPRITISHSPTIGLKTKLEQRNPNDEESRGRERARRDPTPSSGLREVYRARQEYEKNAAVFRPTACPSKSPSLSRFTIARLSTGSPTLKVVVKYAGQKDSKDDTEL